MYRKRTQLIKCSNKNGFSNFFFFLTGDPERNKNAVPSSEIPSYLQEAIAADLAEEKKRQEERQRERDSVKFRIFYENEERSHTMHKACTIGDLMVWQFFFSLPPKILQTPSRNTLWLCLDWHSTSLQTASVFVMSAITLHPSKYWTIFQSP